MGKGKLLVIGGVEMHKEKLGGGKLGSPRWQQLGQSYETASWAGHVPKVGKTQHVTPASLG